MCEELQQNDGVYDRVGFTASGSPYFRHVSGQPYLYHDPSCNSVVALPMWTFGLPNASQLMDLAGVACETFRVYLQWDGSLPMGSNTWTGFCGTLGPLIVTIKEVQRATCEDFDTATPGNQQYPCFGDFTMKANA